jgi:hypothetical protein
MPVCPCGALISLYLGDWTAIIGVRKAPALVSTAGGTVTLRRSMTVKSIQAIHCPQCGSPLSAARLKVHNAKYCSKRCQQKADKERYGLDHSRPAIPRASTGAASELIVCADMLQRGYEVFRAESPACSCDLLVMKDGKVSRVEVRTGLRDKRSGKLSYSPGGVHDVMAIVIAPRNEIIYIPPWSADG